MSFQDPISDCLTRIRNGLMRGKTHVAMPYSKLKHDLVNVLVSEGYLKSCNKTDAEKKPRVLIADTIKGKGVSFMEDRAESHYWGALSEEKMNQMILDLSS